MKLSSLFFLFCSGLVIISAQQSNPNGEYRLVGGSINAMSEEHGGAVDLSHDGSYVAVGSPHAGDNDRGEVKVYRSVFKGNNEQEWEQVGTTIYGISDSAHTGISVALSFKGQVMAVGSLLNEDEYGSVDIYVFKKETGEWMLLHNINGTTEKSGLGKNVALSANGKILAFSENNVAYVYKCYISNCISQEGGEMELNDENSLITDIALSSGGKALAIGSNPTINADNGPGNVQTYKFHMSDGWSSVANFSGENDGDRTGFRVSLSGDGEILAFSSVGFKCAPDVNAGRPCGNTKIYSKDGQSYTQLGNTIEGSAQNPLLGIDIDVSFDGDRIIVTSLNEESEALATIYSISSEESEWVQIQNFSGSSAISSSRSVGSKLNINKYGDRAIFLSPSGENADINVVQIFEKISPSPKPTPSPTPTTRINPVPNVGGKLGKSPKSTKNKGDAKDSKGGKGSKKGKKKRRS